MRGAAARVIEALEARGFSHLGSSPTGWFKLHGTLWAPRAEQSAPCEVLLDPKFAKLPKVRLLEKPASLPSAAPHLGPTGSLCYLDESSVVIDIFDPVGQSLACVERAEAVLDSILLGEFVEDLTEEFFAHWTHYSCYVDLESSALGRHSGMFGKARGKSSLCITDDEARSMRKLEALGFERTGETVLTYRVKTTAQPRPWGGDWPPKTVSEMLSWQSTLDPRCRTKIHERIKEGFRNKASLVLVLIESPLLTYGIAVHLHDALEAEKAKRKPSRLASRGDPTLRATAHPLWLIRIDDQYVAQRSVPGVRTLAGKQVALVGCGTIGGHLGDALIRMGAGTGGGRLTLVDNDTLGAHNIGRHRIGFAHLGANKASALKSELNRVMPSAQIRALPVDVREAELGKPDLIIDASGEEALGHWLCRCFLRRGAMLSVWIEGPGTAVRGLLHESSETACYRCLWHYNRRGELLTVEGGAPRVLAGQGCEGLFVPFPNTVSLHAAALGAEMVLDWVNASSSPLLRTRVLSQKFKAATDDFDPPRHHECPICSS